MNKEFIANENIRLDKFLVLKLNETRNQIYNLIKKGFVMVDGKKNTKCSLKLLAGRKISVILPQTIKTEPLKIDFDIKIIFEDQYILVIHKPAGIIVHGAASVKVPTLVDWLKSKNISLSTISGEERHGIVHRLDKGTSGLMVVAKTNKAHVNLSKQLEDKSMGRFYVAIIDTPLKDNVIIEKPIYRNPNNRLKQAVVQNGKYAKTIFYKLSTSTNEKYELISAKLSTGRTHQIRVHLESINRHILGDTLYGFKGNSDKINRVYLHSLYLYFIHPIYENRISFYSNMPDDMYEFCKNNFNMEIVYEKINEKYLIDSFSNFN